MNYMTPDTLPVLPPKVLTYGKTGTGKSTLTIRMLIGVRAMLGWNDRPIFIMDTEERAQALVANVIQGSGIPNKLVKIAQTRSIYDARQVIRDASKEGGLVMIDQATHLVDDLRAARKKKVGRDRLYMNDYMILKPMFRNVFVDEYLYADIPVFLVARGKDDLRDEIDEDESEKTGKVETKMINHGVEAKLDGDTAYEAYLNILVTTTANPTFTVKARKASNKMAKLVHAAVVKDNYGAIHGLTFLDPHFKHFEPHFAKIGLKPGIKLKAARKPKETEAGDLESIYEHNGQNKEHAIRKELLEEIKTKFAVIFPVRNEKNKGLAGQVMEFISGTSSWTAWTKKTSKELEWYKQHLSALARSKSANIKLDDWDQIENELKVINEFLRQAKLEQEKFNDGLKDLFDQEDDLPFGDAPIEPGSVIETNGTAVKGEEKPGSKKKAGSKKKGSEPAK